MENNKSILLCLEKLDIGGVETYVYNQAVALKRKGYNVIILSKKGILCKKLESQDIKCINFDFENKIYYDKNKINELLEIIKQYNVNEVHINQLSGINIIFPACIVAKVPYIVYLHMTPTIIENQNLNPYDYFEEQFITYKENLKLLFKYAYKIIAVTSIIKDYTIDRYQILDKKKCIVLPNSINFEEYANKKNVTEIKRLAIISRVTFEKVQSIINGINLYKCLKEKSNQKVFLTIVGDGNELNNIKNYVKENDIKDVTFLGGISNVNEIIEKHDIIIGLERCILEAIAMKRLAIISGYNNTKGLVKNENIAKEIEENFCGRQLEDINIDKIAKEILNMNIEKINEIVEKNYNIIRNKLDINNNIYTTNLDEYEYDINISDFMLEMININHKIGKKEESSSNIIEKNWNEHLEYKKWMKEKESILKKECDDLREQIAEINKTIKKENKGVKDYLRKIIKK